MTITRDQFIQELCAARAADPLTYAEGNYAFAVSRAEDLFGPDLRTKEGVEKWIEEAYVPIDPVLQPGVIARPPVHVVETEHHIVLISKTFPASLDAEMRQQGMETNELEVPSGWNEPSLEILVAWKGTK